LILYNAILFKDSVAESSGSVGACGCQQTGSRDTDCNGNLLPVFGDGWQAGGVLCSLNGLLDEVCRFGRVKFCKVIKRRRCFICREVLDLGNISGAGCLVQLSFPFVIMFFHVELLLWMI